MPWFRIRKNKDKKKQEQEAKKEEIIVDKRKKALNKIKSLDRYFETGEFGFYRLVTYLGVRSTRVPRGYEVVERYPLNEPWSYAVIVYNPETGDYRYIVEENKLNEIERYYYLLISKILIRELEPPGENVKDVYKYYMEKADQIINMFKMRLGLTAVGWNKIAYYIKRDMMGFGVIDPLMRDPNIEDISCNGVGRPVYVWHRKYESIPTNIMFDDEETLANFVVKLVHMAGAHISVAYPIVDAILPGGHRLACTYKREVSVKGSSFTIRKFRENPITIVELLSRFKTIDYLVAGYFWLLMEEKQTGMILGVTGAGKSVAGNMVLSVKVNNALGVYTFDELWEQMSRICRVRKQGETEIIEDPPIEVRVVTSDFKVKWARPKYFVRHVNNKKIYRVKLRSGKYVDVTEDHSLIVVDNGRLVVKKPVEDVVGKIAISISDGSAVFDEIVGVFEVDYNGKYVYDFEVPGYENFEANNIIVHNTTTLNAIATLVKPTIKVVTIEDTPEIRLPLENWVQLVTRTAYGGSKASEVTMYDLVRVSLRYRPDIIIVGEVRGEEAQVLMQAVASVSPDTMILIRDRYTGVPRFIRIGDFVDKYYGEDEERIAKSTYGYEVLTIDKKGRIGWKRIKYVLRHKADEIYRIDYTGGTVYATGSHSVFVVDENTGEIIEKPVSLLRKGDLLVTFVKRIIYDKPYKKIDLVDLLEKEINVYAENLNGEIISLTEAKKYKNCLVRLWNSKKVYLPRYMELDEHMAYILGIYYMHGYIVRDKKGVTGRIRFSINEDVFEVFSKIFENKFRVKLKVIDRVNGVVRAEIFSALISKVFDNLFKDGKVFGMIMDSGFSVVRAFVLGILNTRIDEEEVSGYVRVSDIVEAEKIAWIGRLAGFYTRINTMQVYGKTYYEVYVSDNFPSRVPVKALLRLVRMAGLRLPREYRYIEKRDTVTSAVAGTILDYVARYGVLTDTGMKLYKNLVSLVKGDIGTVMVKNVEKQTYDGYVYDISVEDSEAFFGGSTPILLHNTGHGGLTTLHADGVDTAVKRLMGKPMNVPETYIPLIRFMAIVKRISMRTGEGKVRTIRRMTNVWEIRDVNDYVEISRWNARDDTFTFHPEKSIVLKDVADFHGKDLDWAIQEIHRRALVLLSCPVRREIDYRSFARRVALYYANPDKVYRESLEILKSNGIDPTAFGIETK